MTDADAYLRQVLDRYRVPTGSGSPADLARQALVYPITGWANTYLNSVSTSGSYAKGTAVKGTTDLDLFISLRNDTPETLGQIFSSLMNLCTDRGWSPRAQNVSVRITFSGLAIDLVPGKLQPGQQCYHSLYARKNDSWLQTNVALHVSTVVCSGRQEEIRILKIWRKLKNLDFPSFYLELATIEALRGRRAGPLAENVLAGLAWIRDTLPTARLQDPANTNNVVSDTLDGVGKRAVASAAAAATAATNWNQIVS